MKSKFKKFVKRQDGQIFLLALVLLAIGGLMLPPLLSFMGTGIKVSDLHEEEMLSLYAADAGVEEALYILKYQPPMNLTQFPYSGNIIDINGNDVDYTIDIEIVGEDTRRYKITSNATDIIDGSRTTVEVLLWVSEIYSSYGVLALDGDIDFGGNVTIGNPSGFPINIHANGDIDSSSTTTVVGNATATGTITNINVTGNYTITENVDYEVTVDIDTSTSSTYYTDAWNTLPHYGDLTVDNYTALGPAYIDGDLTIDKNGTVNLTGHLWVTGSMELGGEIISAANVSEETPIKDLYAIVVEEDIICPNKFAVVGSDGSYILLISLYESLAANDPAMAINGGFLGAILYAPNGKIDIEGNATVKGAAIGESVEINGTFSATYPFPAQNDNNEREIDILSYIIK